MRRAIDAVRQELERRPWLTALLIAAVAFGVYAGSLANGFAYDDYWIIDARPIVHDGLTRIGALLSSHYWPDSFSTAGLYRPVTMLTYAVDWHIWAGNPAGFHLVNVLLHALVSVLVFFVLARVFPFSAALAGGLVFAVHSVHTEAVANVVGRAEILTTLFILIGCLLYMTAVRAGRVTVPILSLIAISYLLAGLSKETGFVMPGLLLATDLPLLARETDPKGFVRMRVPLFVVLTAVLVLLFIARWAVLGEPIQNVPDRAFSVDQTYATRLFTMAGVWPRYLELSLFPLDLSADYSPAVIMPADHLTMTGVLGFVLVGSLIGLAIAGFKRVPEFTLAVLWFAVAILPVSNLVIIVEIILAERTLYLPSVAASFVAAFLLARASGPRRDGMTVALAAWVILFSVVTVQRVPVWESTDSVFEDLRKKHPESSRLLWGVGDQFYMRGNWPAAKKWFDRSLEIWPYQSQSQAEYALYLNKRGELEEAEEHAAMAVNLESRSLSFHELLVLIRLRRGDVEGALAALDTALARLGPEGSLYVLRADAFMVAGQPDSAAAAQAQAVGLMPQRWIYWLRLARLRLAAGDTVGALAALGSGRGVQGADTAMADSLGRTWRSITP